MDRRALGRSGIEVSPIGYGAFKIGRNEGIKYPQAYDLPDEKEADALLHGLLDLGVALIDTAPAYGSSEERIGRAISSRRDEFTLSTKVGETWEAGESTFDFTRTGMERSVRRSLERLQCDAVDLLLVHSDGRDLPLHETDRVDETMRALRDQGYTQAIGFSGKTKDGMLRALEWSDAIMVEYHAANRTMEDVIRAAGDRGIGVLVKKGLGSGHLDPQTALEFLLRQSPVCEFISSIVIGSLSLERMSSNVGMACV